MATTDFVMNILNAKHHKCSSSSFVILLGVNGFGGGLFCGLGAT